MRICMVTTFYPPYSFGGDAIYVRALSRGLVARGHEVEVVHCADAFELLHRGPLPDLPADEDGITVHHLTSRFGRLSPLVTQQTGHPGPKARALHDLLDHGRFDVVHFHIISLVGGPAVLGYSRAAVTLYTLHEHWLICATHILWKDRERACDGRTCLRCCLRSGTPPQLWRYGSLVSRSLAHVDRLLSPSAFTADQHRAQGIDRPIEILPLFAAFAPAEPQPLPPRPRFVFVGRLIAPKGIEPVLAAFANLPAYDFVVIGDGDQRAMLAERYRTCPNISFLGRLPQTELAAQLATATALVFPSVVPETFGLGIVEAAVCGVPTIVNARSGGAPEVVSRTGGGIVYATDAELVAAIHWLATDPAARDRLGRLARDGCETHYTLTRHLDRYEAIVAEIGATKAVARAAA